MKNRLYKLLAEFNPIIPYPTIEELHRLAREGDILPALIEIIEEGGKGFEDVAIWALEDMGDSRAEEQLIKLLQKPGFAFRSQIIWALAKCGTEKSEPVLVELLQDKDFDVRVCASGALGELKNPASVDALVEALRDSYSRVCDYAVESLARIGMAAVPALSEAVADSRDQVRLYAVRALKEIAAPEGLSALTRSARDSEAKVRVETAAALGRLNTEEVGKQVVTILISLLKDPQPAVRRQAAASMAGNTSQEAMAALFEAANDAEVEVAVGALRALGKCRNPQAFDYLLEFMENSQGEVRAEALIALADTEDSRSYQVLTEKIRDESPEVGRLAIWMLGHKKMVEAFDLLVELLRDERMEFRAQAAHSLAQLGDGRAIAPLKAALPVSDARTNQIINQAINLLELQSKDSRGRGN